MIIASRYSCPATIVEGKAHDQLAGGKSARNTVIREAARPGFEGRINVVLRVARRDSLRWVAWRVMERVLEVGGAGCLKTAMHVIGHGIGVVQIFPYLIGLNLRDLILTGGHRSGKLKVLAEALTIAVQFVAELLQQQRVVALILWPVVVACMPQHAWIFPVDVKAIEESGRRSRATGGVTTHIRWQIALEEHVDAGTHKLLTRSRRGRRIRKVLGVGPAAQ